MIVFPVAVDARAGIPFTGCPEALFPRYLLYLRDSSGMRLSSVSRGDRRVGRRLVQGAIMSWMEGRRPPSMRPLQSRSCFRRTYGEHAFAAATASRYCRGEASRTPRAGRHERPRRYNILYERRSREPRDRRVRECRRRCFARSRPVEENDVERKNEFADTYKPSRSKRGRSVARVSERTACAVRSHETIDLASRVGPIRRVARSNRGSA